MWMFFRCSLLSCQSSLTSCQYHVRPANTAISSNANLKLCVFYCTFGDVLSNLLWCGMMIVVSYHSIRGLAYAQIQTGTACKMRYFHIGVLCYVAVEYVLWISGCLWPGYSISAPYCWFDLLLTGSLFALLPATGKAVQA